MQEKDMVNDYLSMLNSSLAGYGGIISQTDNAKLRQTLQDMRNQDEARQYTVYQKAKSKGYYKPASAADESEVSQVKTDFTQGQ